MYEVKRGTSFISNGVVYSEGDKITENDFATKEIFNQFVSSGKIIKKAGDTTASDLEKKIAGLKKSVEAARKNLEAKPEDKKLKQKFEAASENLVAVEEELLNLQERVE